MTSVAHAQRLVTAMNRRLTKPVTVDLYIAWLEGRSGQTIFNRAVLAILGRPLYDDASQRARLDLVLTVKLRARPAAIRSELEYARTILRAHKTH